MKEYNEDDAIRHMRASVDGADAYDDDQILNLIDIIFDYYDDNGGLDIDCASALIARDKGSIIRQEHIAPLVAAEIEYEISLI